MKIFKTKRTKNSYKLFNENEDIVGEVLFDFVLRKNIRIKINDEIYIVEQSGFLWSNFKFFDDNEKLVAMIDSSKNRMFYYGHPYTEIYYFKTTGWLQSSTDLYKNENDRLLMRFKYRQLFFKLKYEIEVENDFSNVLVMLAFLYYNIEIIEN